MTTIGLTGGFTGNRSLTPNVIGITLGLTEKGFLMATTSNSVKVIRFGVFELDLSAGELRKSGLRIKLQEQPFQVLAALLERPGGTGGQGRTAQETLAGWTPLWTSIMAWAAPLIDCGKPSVTRQKIPVLLRPCRGGNIGSLRRWILPGWPVIPQPVPQTRGHPLPHGEGLGVRVWKAIRRPPASGGSTPAGLESMSYLRRRRRTWCITKCVNHATQAHGEAAA